ncbi:MAG: sulfotransferase [Chlorobi bacterium]|nr:sulfotransferase [Chlorobiota bacterium]
MRKPVFRKKKFSFPVNSLIGSYYSNFITITRKYRIDKKYRYYFTKWVCRILDLFASIEKEKQKHVLENSVLEHPPIFIIGFWRSGTTLLHNLLCKNPLFGYVTTFHSVFPNHILWNQKWLKPLMTPVLPEKRPGDNMKFDFDYPQEEEIALGNMQPVSFYNFFYFPDDTEKIINESLFFKNVTETEIKRWKREYMRLIKTALINTDGECFTSKNPSNTFRIKTLLEMFPGARFIYLHRNRYDTLISFRKFVHEVDAGITLQDYDHERLDREMIRLYKLLHEKYEQDKSLIPKGRLVEIDFEVFENNKLKEIERIYKELGLKGFKKALPVMEKYLESLRGYERSSYNNNEAFRKIIDEELRDFIGKD